ncbi:MAG: prephenate dehydrogenase/arogenate dehydrogenase family protein [Planctomycetota bacterium]
MTIIGVGLLGGSAGLAIKAWDPEIHVAGVGRRAVSLQVALEAGAIDSMHLDVTEPASRTDLVVLATPVGTFETYLKQLADGLADGAIVTDVGSTKADVVAQGEAILGVGGPFVGSHPMAGSEQRGPQWARGDLFEHRFPVGAIACHVASFEAANIHRYETWGEHIPWCSGFLHDGITVTIGPVAEPYLLAFPQTEPFFTHLYQGWSVGEAYWSSIAHTSWRLILVGDPLYAPFAHAPLLRPDALTTDDDNDGSADATDG